MTIEQIIENQELQIAAFFEEHFMSQNMSIKDYCKGTDLSAHTVSNFINRRHYPLMEKLCMLMRAKGFVLILAIVEEETGITIFEPFDPFHPYDGIIQQGYAQYLTKTCSLPSASKQHVRTRPNDQLSLSVDTGISTKQLNRIFKTDNPPSPYLDTLLRLWRVFGIQVSFSPPNTWLNVDPLVLNTISNAASIVNPMVAQPK